MLALLRWLAFLIVLVCLGIALHSYLPSLHEGDKVRPFGYLRLGTIASFNKPFTLVDRAQVVVFRDYLGLAAMSTLCNHDLSPLRLIDRGDEDAKEEREPDSPGAATGVRAMRERLIFASELSSSRYDIVGNLLAGPATRSLPYYELVLDTSQPLSPETQVFVYIGREVDPTWRLPLKVAMVAQDGEREPQSEK